MATIAPVLLWGLVISVAPTEWARKRVEAGLAEATNCPARVARLRFGLLGGVRLEGVSLREPGDAAGRPWLRARTVRIDLGPIGLAIRGPTPRRVVIDGLDLRVGRLADGSFPLACLFGPSDDPSTLSVSAYGEMADDDHPAIDLELRHGALHVLDGPSGNVLDVLEVEASATLWSDVLEIDDLEGRVRDGQLRMALEVERGDVPAFDLRLRADGVRVDGTIPMLNFLLPFLAGVDQAGLLALDLTLQGKGSSPAALRTSLKGGGRVRLDPVRLDHSSLARQLARVVSLPSTNRLGSLSSDFEIADERVSTASLAFGFGRRRFSLEGSTTFDGEVDYLIEAQALADDVDPEMGELLRGLAVDANGLIRVEIRGPISEPSLLLNGKALVESSTEEPIEDLSRLIRQRLLR